jgi:hypothetical protein
METSMDIKALASELADLRIDTGYIFENGAPFYEALKAERAEALLKALLERGYVLCHLQVDSPSIYESDDHQHDPVHH